MAEDPEWRLTVKKGKDVLGRGITYYPQTARRQALLVRLSADAIQMGPTSFHPVR